MENLDFLIRTLTYKRSCLELKWKDLDDDCKLENQGVREGLSIAITQIYKLLGELSNENQQKLIEFMEKGEWSYGTNKTE